MAARVRLARAAVTRYKMDVARRLVTRVVRQTQNRSKIQTPVDTGFLRGSHVSKIVVHGSKVIGTITVLAEYALPVHEGWQRTAPIRPVRKQALKFKIGGNTVIVKAVYAPASYPGRPFLRRALYQVAVPEGFIVTG